VFFFWGVLWGMGGGVGGVGGGVGGGGLFGGRDNRLCCVVLPVVFNWVVGAWLVG